MDYKDYQNSRNAAWKLLLDLDIQTLPVNPGEILKKIGIPFGTYRKNQKLIQHYRLEKIAKTSSAFTLYITDVPIVLFDDTEMKERIRFSLAHELGHIICGHLSHGQITLRNKEPSKGDDRIEREANMFAARLLAPVCVFHEVQIFDAERISEICGISMQSATFRSERLKLLEERNKKFYIEKGHGCYYQSPLERQLLEQFQDYINHLKSGDPLV